jgi:hypothetical protein
LDTSAFEPIDAATMEQLLNRAKQRSAQLRRRRALLLFGSIGRLGSRGGASPPVRVRTPAAPRRFSPTVAAFAAVGVVAAVAIALVLVDVTSGGSGGRIPVAGQTTSPTADGNSLAPVLVPAPASVVDAVTGVTTEVANAVGVPSTSTVAPPSVQTGQPPLEIDGKPAAIFIGGEFCPYCAAERWAIVMAFSRFGTFNDLSETTSSPWDTDPSTPTFSFYGATYTSPLLTLATSEHESNDTNGLGTRTLLQPLTDLESSVWQKYDNPEGFPFLDIGNSVFVLSPSFDPNVLAGLDQADVAGKLTDPDDPATKAIVGTANYLTAAICSMIGSNSSSWCTQPAVTAAARAMGLDLRN